jgi:glutaryl-CoA dehydrogenase
MHLSGYGALGANAVSYGLACLELEAGDSGFRSFVSVQGSLCMFPIWKYGSEAQKEEYLPKMAAGELIGCFGLTEPDFGSDPSRMRTRAEKRGDAWVINGTKMWITNGGIAEVAIIWANTEEGVRGFLVPTDANGFTANDIHRKLSLRASVTSELVLEGRCRASPRRGTGSCGARWAQRAHVSRARSSTPRRACSSASRSRRSS